MLGLIFGIHGTNEDMFINMVDFYEEMNTNLMCINELLDKQVSIPKAEIKKVKKIFLEIFSKKAKFVKECFLSFKNFDSNEMIKLYPTILKI